MPVVFPAQAGRVVALIDPAVPGDIQLLSVQNFGSFNSMRCLITRVGVGQQGNHQFLMTLGSSIYIYVFGDRPGSVNISGVATPGDCDSSGGRHGIERLSDYYGENKMSARATDLEVMVGTTPLRGFLTGVQVEVTDTERYLANFSLTMATLPAGPTPRE